MTTTTKSLSITALDALPVTNGANTAGEGAAAYAKVIMDYAVPTVGNPPGNSIVKFVRLPMTAKIKSLRVESAAQTKGSYDFGLYYSDSTIDGTLPSVQGTAINQSLFVSGLSLASAVKPTDETNQSGHYGASLRNEPIWIAAGIATANVSGFVDVVAVSTTTVSVAGQMAVQVEFNT